MNITKHEVDSKVEDYPPHTAVAVSVLPDCDVCKNIERKMKPERALFDAKTHAGPWAYLCHPHMQSHGCGRLGTGYGQRLVIPGLNQSIARHPAGKGRRSEVL
jgi:hypothetical protein